MSRYLLCSLVLMSASTVFGQEKVPPEAQEDPLANGRVHLVREPGGHSGAPQHLLFTPDGKKLISASEDHTVQVWDIQTRERLRVIRLPVSADSWGNPERKATGPDDPTHFASLSIPGQGIRFAKAPLVVDRQGERVSFCTEVN